MKIDTDLRAAIRSADKARPKPNWSTRDAAAKEAIADFVQRYPAKAKQMQKLAEAQSKHYAAYLEAGKQLCEKFGLKVCGSEFRFADCGEGHKRFVKAGGRIPKDAEPWTFDSVMAQLAAASPAEGAAIIKKLGINWS